MLKVEVWRQFFQALPHQVEIYERVLVGRLLVVEDHFADAFDNGLVKRFGIRNFWVLDVRCRAWVLVLDSVCGREVCGGGGVGIAVAEYCPPAAPEGWRHWCW